MYNFKDKARNVKEANAYTFAKTVSMFEWQNLPETIPHRELELMLQAHGYAFITKVEGELYAFTGGIGGEQDVYGNPTQIVVANPALKLNKTYDLKKDGVLIYSDDSRMGLLPLLNKYNGLLVESDITMVVSGFNARIGTLISASDDKTKQSAELFMKRIAEGEPAVIGESALFDGVKAHPTSKHTPITELVEYHQYVKASLSNELGLSAAFNMKRERVNSAEVAQNDDTTFPFVDNMMKCRLEAVKKLNAMYDLTIDVDYGSVWSSRRRDLVDDVVEPTPPIEVNKDGTTVEVPAVGTGKDGAPEVGGLPDQQDPTKTALIVDPELDPLVDVIPEPEDFLVQDEAEAWDQAIVEDAEFTAKGEANVA